MVTLTLTFLGSFQAAINSAPIAHFRSDKVRALLAYLAVEGDRPHSRASLCGLLWPDQSDDAALHNLSQTLLRLREAIGDTRSAASFLRISRQAIQWNGASDHQIDAADFARLASSTNAADLDQAAALYRGEFLPGFSLPGCAAFEEWLLLARERFAHLALAALEQLTWAQLAAGRYPEAAQHARRQIALDPWHEEAHRQLMRALAGAGDRAAALAAYERCRQTLRDDLGVDPDPSTNTLYEQIRTSASYELRVKSSELPAPELKTQNHALERSEGSKLITQLQDWGEMPAVDQLYGRTAEIDQLEGWLGRKGATRCRLVVLLGMGGAGKTTLAAAVVKAAAPAFDSVIWRSLLNAPPVAEIVQSWLHILARQTLINLPDSADEQLRLLLDYLRRHRCLLVLDNLESILQPGAADEVRPGYEGYAHLLQYLGESEHQSVLLLTSREQPQALIRFMGQPSAVRVLHLAGLDAQAGHAILQAQGLTASPQEAHALVQHYSGNPLALQLVAQTVQELFDGATPAFLAAGAPIFDDIRTVLDQQFVRLSALEREILIWLAIEREAVTLQTLRPNLLQPPPVHGVLDALRSLQRRSLLEKVGDGFTLQNVVMEYTTDRLIEGVCTELLDDKINVANAVRSPAPLLPVSSSPVLALSLFNRHALLKAQSKEYVQQSQQRLILHPIAEQLLARCGQARVEVLLRRLLDDLRIAGPRLPGYAAGNILNLLLHLGTDLRGYDFSQLCVWQAALRGVSLPAISFAAADLHSSALTDAFNAVNTVAFSPDDRLLAAGTSSGLIRIWRVEDWQPVASLRGHTSLVQSITFSPDGRWLCSGSDDCTVRVWDIVSGTTIRTLLGHTHVVKSVAFSPDGARLATGSWDQTVRLWDADGTLLHTLQQHNRAVGMVAFSPDGILLASGSWDRAVRLWDVQSGALIQTLNGHTRAIMAVAFSPDGGTLASAGWDRAIQLWDLATGQIRHTLHGHTDVIMQLAFSPAGTLLASCSDDTTARLWDTQTGQPLRILDHRTSVRSIAFDPQGTLLASGSLDQTVQMWATATGQALHVLRGHTSQAQTVAFSADSATFASGGEDKLVRLWSVHADEAPAVLHGHTNVVLAVAFSPDGTILASGGDWAIRLWDVRTRRPLQVLHGHADGVNALAFSPDGRRLASCSDDHSVRIWDVQTGACLYVLHGHPDAVKSAAFSADGTLLASAGSNQRVNIWHVDEARVIHTLPGGHTGTAVIMALNFAVGERPLAGGSWDQVVWIWELYGASAPRVLEQRGSRTTTVTFSPDGQLLARGGSDHVIDLYATATGARVQTLQGHTGAITAIAFSANAGTLVSSDYDQTIRLWDIETGVCRRTLRVAGPYAGMNIAGATGISAAQKAALKALGAVEVAAQPNQTLDASRDTTTGATSAAPVPPPPVAPVRTTQLDWADGSSAPPHNLPTPLTPLLGREDELAQLAALSDGDTRLVTVVGAGGAGKTRLALAAAGTLRLRFANGTWLVALAGVQPADDPALQRTTLASAVATALGLTLGGRRAALDELADVLDDRALLLVLDNCEHLPEVAAVVHALLEAAPKLRVLATSREPLGLGGEALLRLEGLPVPAAGAADPARYPSIRLFLERAARHVPGWKQSAAEVEATARLCRLLDGLPLGIELAAHWVGHYTPDEIAEAIQADLNFLAARTRDVPDRHRSLRAVFDYAWRALTEAEQRMLAQAAVFQGSFSRAALLTVTEAGIAALVNLVDKSLFRQVETGRYSMHELLRQFAISKLAQFAGEPERTHAAHARYYARFLAERQDDLKSKRQEDALDEIASELDNIRLAWKWALDQRDIPCLQQATFSVWYVHEARASLTEAEHMYGQAVARLAAHDDLASQNNDEYQIVFGQLLALHGKCLAQLGQAAAGNRRLEEAVSRLHQTGPHGRPALVQALWLHSYQLLVQGDTQRSLQSGEAALAIARALGDPWSEGMAAFFLGLVYERVGELEQAVATLTRGVDVLKSIGHSTYLCASLEVLGRVATARGHYDEANRLLQQGFNLIQKLTHFEQRSSLLREFGILAVERGDLPHARHYLEESVQLLREFGERVTYVVSLNELGRVARLQRNFAEAESYHRECLTISQNVEMAWNTGISVTLNHLAGLAYDQGDFKAAEQLCRESLAIAGDLARKPLNMPGWLWLAYSSCQLSGAYLDQGALWLYKTLTLGLERQTPPLVLGVIVGVVMLLKHTQPARVDMMIELLALVRAHPACAYETKVAAQQLWGNVTANLANEVIQAAEGRGQQRNWEATIEDCRACLRPFVGRGPPPRTCRRSS